MNRKIVGMIFVLLILLVIISSGCISEEKKEEKKTEEGPVEASSGDIKISNVYISPENPKVEEDIDYFVTVTSVPSGYSVVVITEEYNGSLVIGSSALNMRKTNGDKYKAGDILSGTGYESGIVIKYWIKIYSKDFDEIEDFEDETAILESLEHSFTLQ
jgi:hypothetical protein